MRDCPICGHDRVSHNTGTCTVTAVQTAEGFTEYSGGCGCTALVPDRTCPTCGQRFYCGDPAHPTHDCRACYEGKREDTDRVSFAPLVAALRKVGIPEVPDDPWNTGGHVMCLAVEMPLPAGAPEGAERPYFLFSDGAENLGAGLYIGDEAWLDFTPDWAVEADRSDEATYDWAVWAQRTADWFAPVHAAVADWLASGGVTLSTTPYTSPWGDGLTTEATVHRLPVVPATLPIEGEYTRA